MGLPKEILMGMKQVIGFVLEVVVYDDDDDKYIMLRWTFVTECCKIVTSKT
jgi:hypothetical protein